MRRRLSAAEVAELAELLDDAPRRSGLVEEVLQAAAEGRGMTLALVEPGSKLPRPALKRAARTGADPDADRRRRK